MPTNQHKSETEILRKTIELCAAFSWEWDVATDQFVFTAGRLATFGYTENLLRQTLTDIIDAIIHPEDKPILHETAEKYRAGNNAPESFNQRIRIRDLVTERWVWFELFGQHLSVSNGKVISLCGGLVNIDAISREKENISAALAIEKEFHSTTFDHNPQMTYLFDDTLQLVDINPAALKFFNYPDKQTALDRFSKEVQNFVPEKQPDGRLSVPLEQRLKNTIQTGYDHSVTLFHIGTQSYWGDLAFVRVPYKDAFGMVLYANDITELRSAFDASEANAQLLETHIALQDAVWRVNPQMNMLFDNQRRIVNVNPSFLQFFGYPDRETAVRCFWQDIDGFLSAGQSEDRTPVPLKDRIRQAIEEGVCRTETRLCILGKFFILDLTFIRVPMEDGYGCSICGIDITKLRNSADQAASAASAKTAFLSSISHEIRTPMNAIIGMTALARKSRDLARIERYLGKIEENGNRLLHLINDVLDISKIESGKLRITESEFDYTKMCRNALNVVAEQAQENHITLKSVFRSKFARTILADELRISQILVNLLSNAVKFTPQGGTVSITSEIQETQGEWLSVSVSDTGIGITPEQIERLFSPFEQADDSTTRQYGGSGLGLAICKQICSLMGGDISVESSPGEGSTFHFLVPITWGRELSPTYAKPGTALENLRILVVDDDSAVTEYFAEILDTYYIKADTANNGKQALELAKTKEYDIVFLDWGMPEMGGGDVAKELKRIYPDIKIIIISSYDRSDLCENLQALDITEYMPKPLPPSEIYNRIIDVSGIELPEADKHHFCNKRILLVEDIEVNRLIITTLLEDTEAVVEEAKNGEEAVAMFRANPNYDIILMDMQMPVMDGLTATREIRKLPEGGSLPIIAMTANAFKEDAIRCLEAGMNAHLSKPIDITVFMETLERYLSD